MITLGKDMVSIYPSNGITWENRGTIIFGGMPALEIIVISPLAKML